MGFACEISSVRENGFCARKRSLQVKPVPCMKMVSASETDSVRQNGIVMLDRFRVRKQSLRVKPAPYLKTVSACETDSMHENSRCLLNGFCA